MAASEATAPARTKAEREAMLMQVQKAIGSEVRRSKVPAHQHEDVEQECQLAVWRATEMFDPNRGTKWSTYAIGAMKNMLANWKTQKHHEEDGSVVSKGNEFFALHAANEDRGSLSDEEEADDGEGIDGETMGRLANAVRAGLSDGVLSKLGPRHRRLVERVAFDGLTADQIATQDGHPVKAVRANLKAAIRQLCKAGATQHAVTDEQVKSATAPAQPVSDEQRRESNRKHALKSAADTQLRDALTSHIDKPGAEVGLSGFAPEVQQGVRDVVAKTAVITNLGARWGTTGPKVRVILNRVLEAMREGIRNAALAQAVTDAEPALNVVAAVVEPDAPEEDLRVVVSAIGDGSLTLDEAVELIGGYRAAIVDRLNGVPNAVAWKGGNVAQVERGELVTA